MARRGEGGLMVRWCVRGGTVSGVLGHQRAIGRAGDELVVDRARFRRLDGFVGAGGRVRDGGEGGLDDPLRDREERVREVAVDEHDDGGLVVGKDDVFRRSEEHTSELQSLMRISYAVFCLKKKTK